MKTPSPEAVRRALNLDGEERRLAEEYLEARRRLLMGTKRPLHSARLWAGWAIHHAGGAEHAIANWQTLRRTIPIGFHTPTRSILSELVRIIRL